MKHFYTLLLFVFLLSISFAQTTVYTTGQNNSDPWTGWTTPVTTNVSNSSVNTADIYTFSLSGGSGASYSIETTRAFNIQSTDIDIYLAATTQNATLSVEYSEDNSTWTSIGSVSYGAGFAQQTLIIPTYAPGAVNFYLKIKMIGTVGSPSNASLNNLKIDAVLSSGIKPTIDLSNAITYYNNTLNVNIKQDFNLVIYDLSGKIINRAKNQAKYDLSNLNAGIYFAKVILKSGQVKTIKLIK